MQLLEQLYNEQKQIEVHLSDKPHIYTLVLIGRDGTPDFKLSSFSANLWVRSDKGARREKYASIEGIKKAVKRLINKNIETNGKVTFKIVDEVCRI